MVFVENNSSYNENFHSPWSCHLFSEIHKCVRYKWMFFLVETINEQNKKVNRQSEFDCHYKDDILRLYKLE